MSKKPNRYTPQPYGHATPWSRRAAEDAAVAAAAETAAAEGAATSVAAANAAAKAAAGSAAAREATSAPDPAAPDSAAAHRSALESANAPGSAPAYARAEPAHRVARLWPWALAVVLAAIATTRLVYDAALNRPHQVRLGS